jgi:hypothetical protein
MELSRNSINRGKLYVAYGRQFVFMIVHYGLIKII